MNQGLKRIELVHVVLYVPALNPARYHTFVEIDHGIISTVILLPSADLFKKGCCQLQAKVCAQNYWLTACSCLPRKKCG